MLTFKLNRLSNFDLFRFFPTIDLIQHQNFQEKRNPFHCRFTHKTSRFWYAKLMNI